MAKKTKKKQKQKYKLRNAAPAAAAPRNVVVTRAPRAAKAPEETSLRRLGYTAAGAAGTALAGSFLAKEGWAPKTIATALAAVGAGLAWKGDESTIRSVGAGAMSAAGSQLALMIIDDRDRKASDEKASTTAATDAKKPANANGLPPGALESALERARARLALSVSDPMDDAT